MAYPGLGFPHRAGRYIDPGDVFVPVLLGLQIYRRISDPGMEPYPRRVALALGSPNPRLGFPHLARAVSTRETTVFVPSLLELYMYGRIHDLILPGLRWLSEPQVGVFTSCEGSIDP